MRRIMGKKWIYKTFLFIATVQLIVSCQDDKNNPLSTGENDEIQFDVCVTTRADYESDMIDSNQDKYFVQDQSVVYISQRSTNLNTDFTPESTNCYKYIYNGNESANWETGFNFKPVTEALNWGKILENGQYGQVFAFAILYFPGGDKDAYPYKVGTDQNEPSMENEPVNFFKWDILGGYHRSGKIRERLRFRLRHMMSRLKVTLYIPKVNSDLASGYEVSDIKATALSFRTDYTVTFGDMDSEGVPMAQPSNDVGVEPSVEDIQMKKISAEETTLTKDYLSNFNIVNLDEDEVYKYTFDMIFPPQAVGIGDVLKFTLINSGGESVYLFNSNNNLTNGNGNFKFEGGTVTNLELYLPRADNSLVLFRANVVDWNEISTSFIVTPDADKP